MNVPADATWRRARKDRCRQLPGPQPMQGPGRADHDTYRLAGDQRPLPGEAEQVGRGVAERHDGGGRARHQDDRARHAEH